MEDATALWYDIEGYPFLEYRRVYEIFGEAPVFYIRVKNTVRAYRSTIDMMRNFKCIADDEISIFIEHMQYLHGYIEEDIKQWKQKREIHE